MAIHFIVDGNRVASDLPETASQEVRAVARDQNIVTRLAAIAQKRAYVRWAEHTAPHLNASIRNIA